MGDRRRRFSTAQQINPDTLKVISKNQQLDSIQDVEEGDVQPSPYRKQSIPGKLTSTFGQLALFKDDEEDEKGDDSGGKSFIAGFTTPGPKERASSAKKKANLGVMLGVYLPTIQHILGNFN